MVRWKKNNPPKNADGQYETGIFAIKLSARTVVRENWHDAVLPWIVEKSILSSKICALASLLFATKVNSAFDHGMETGDYQFFLENDGDDVIRNCFYAVLIRYKDTETMDPWFREIVDNLDAENRFNWPKNNYFNNQFKYLYQEYMRNVTTNLTTHQKNRLRQYLSMKAWQFNVVSDGSVIFNDRDIDNAVNWAIRRYDSTTGNAARLLKRGMLLEFVRAIGGPVDDDVGRDTRDNWFESLIMWTYMQREISEFHNWVEDSQLNDTVPSVKNLKVIPICTFMRKPVKIDSTVLYGMMCELRIIPRDENGSQVSRNHVIEHHAHFFDQIFNMDHINRILKANKQFRYHILCDGESASVLYNVPTNVLRQLDNDELVRKRYYDGYYAYELGLDPGMKTWNATVRRHIDTGKEVLYEILFSINYIVFK